MLPRDEMYRQYFYTSSANPTMVSALQDLVTVANRYVSGFSRCLDIGCNDGTLLSFYPSTTFRAGFDPANNLAHAALLHCDVFINDYFSDVIKFARRLI